MFRRTDWSFLFTVPKTLFPLSFGELASRSLWDSFKYFLSLLVLCFFLLAALILPPLLSLPETLQSGSPPVELEMELHASPLRVGSLGLLVADSAEWGNVSSRDAFVAGGNMVAVKRLRCIVLEPSCLLMPKSDRFYSIETRELGNLKNPKTEKAVQSLLLLLLPGMFLVLYVAFLLKYLALVLVASAVAFVVTRLFLAVVQLRKIVKAGLYALTVLAVPEIANLRFNYSLFYLPLALYIILFSIAVYVVRERD